MTHADRTVVYQMIAGLMCSCVCQAGHALWYKYLLRREADRLDQHADVLVKIAIVAPLDVQCIVLAFNRAHVFLHDLLRCAACRKTKECAVRVCLDSAVSGVNDSDIPQVDDRELQANPASLPAGRLCHRG